MCVLCDQREIVEDLCLAYSTEEISVHVVAVTPISMIVVLGDETYEPMGVIQNRSKAMHSALQSAGLAAHPHRGHFKPQHFLAVLHNFLPGSRPSSHPH